MPFSQHAPQSLPISNLSFFHSSIHLLNPQEPVFSSTYSPPISLGQKCQYTDHHTQVRTLWASRAPASYFCVPVFLTAWVWKTVTPACWKSRSHVQKGLFLCVMLELTESHVVCAIWCIDFISNSQWGKLLVTMKMIAEMYMMYSCSIFSTPWRSKLKGCLEK